MTERRAHPQPELAPPARALVQEIERLSGLPIVIEPRVDMGGRARAAYVVSDPDHSRHLVIFDPTYREFLDHMVAHECGHISRHACAPTNEPALLVQNSKGANFDMLIDEMTELLDRGLPNRFLEELTPLWIHGSLAQLQNMPADIHIEQWLHREVPELREAQWRSIKDQAEDYHEALTPDVQDMTPPQIWLAGNAMNYALLKAMGDLFDRPDLYEPFDATPKVVLLGELLLDDLESRDDTGLAGDREITDLWAKRLGMETWYRWHRMDELPTNIKRLWEGNRRTKRR